MKLGIVLRERVEVWLNGDWEGVTETWGELVKRLRRLDGLEMREVAEMFNWSPNLHRHNTPAALSYDMILYVIPRHIIKSSLVYSTSIRYANLPSNFSNLLIYARYYHQQICVFIKIFLNIIFQKSEDYERLKTPHYNRM